MSFFNFPKWPYTDFHRLNLDWVLEAFNAVQGKIDAIAGLTAYAETLPTGEDAFVIVSGGAGSNNPYALHFGLPRGLTGEGVTIEGEITEYAASDSGITPPSEGWTPEIPPTLPGQYLWSKITITLKDESGTKTSFMYIPARQGIDGQGSVKSVNSVIPDATGNVTIPALLYREQNLTTSEQLAAAKNMNARSVEPMNFYVNGYSGDDSNLGTADSPFKTIQAAVDKIPLWSGYNTPTIHIVEGAFDSFAFSCLTPISVHIDGNVSFTGTMSFTHGRHSLFVNDALSVKQISSNYGGGVYIQGNGTITFNTGNDASIIAFSTSVGIAIADTVNFIVNNSDVLFQAWAGCQINASNSARIRGTASTVAIVLSSIVMLDGDPVNLSRTTLAQTYWGGRFFMGNQTYPEV